MRIVASSRTSPVRLPGVVSVIFDMDGVLVDSEPLWWEAGVAALGSVGVVLGNDRSLETKGMRTIDALEYWYRKFPWSGKSIDDLVPEVHERVIEIMAEHAQPLPGVVELVQFLSDRGVPMSVCSSAPRDVIEATLRSLGLRRSIVHIVSANDEAMGKPHPGSYLRCAKLMDTNPRHCIAIEDSVYGAIAAKAAQMKVVAVQSGPDSVPGIFDFCDTRISTLKEFDGALFQQLSEAR